MKVRYICLDCGEIFEEPHEYSECMGEFWGQPAYEDFADCPNCGGGYIELTDEMEDVYDLAYNKGRREQKDIVNIRLNLIPEYADVSKMTGTEVMNMIKEIINAKDVAEMVRKYSNKWD